MRPPRPDSPQHAHGIDVRRQGRQGPAMLPRSQPLFTAIQQAQLAQLATVLGAAGHGLGRRATCLKVQIMLEAAALEPFTAAEMRAALGRVNSPLLWALDALGAWDRHGRPGLRLLTALPAKVGEGQRYVMTPAGRAYVDRVCAAVLKNVPIAPMRTPS